MHLDSNTPGAARPLVDEVLAKDPSDQDALMIAYLIALKIGSDTAKAKAAALEAIGQRSTVAQVLLEQGFLEEGEKVLSEAVVKEPDDPLAAVLLAALLLGTQRADEANKLKDEVLARTPVGEQRDGLKQLFEAAFEQARQAIVAQPPESPPATP